MQTFPNSATVATDLLMQHCFQVLQRAENVAEDAPGRVPFLPERHFKCGGKHPCKPIFPQLSGASKLCLTVREKSSVSVRVQSDRKGQNARQSSALANCSGYTYITHTTWTDASPEASLVCPSTSRLPRLRREDWDWSSVGRAPAYTEPRVHPQRSRNQESWR